MNRNTFKSIAIACGLALTLSTIAATSFARGSGHSSRGNGHVGRSFSHRGNFSRFSNYRYHNFRGYYGWGYYPSYYSYGWGWGCWNTPYSYGNSYSVNSYSNNSYGDNSYGSPTTAVNAPGSPAMPNLPPQDAALAPPSGGPIGPAGNPANVAAATNPGPAGSEAPANNEQANADDEASTPDAPPTAAATPSPATQTAGQPADGPKPVVPPAPADPLVGTFKAKPAPDVQIELTMRADTTFTWKFTAGGKTQTFSGLYELAPNSLTLTRDGGEKMDGTLERVGTTGFKFRMKGADAQDPGLTFSL
jgi:hypothetical protein